MQLARQAVNALLGIFIFLDLVCAWELWRHGPPMVVTDFKEIKQGEISFKMTPAPFAQHVYITPIIVIALH